MTFTEDYRERCTDCGRCIDVCPQYDDVRLIDALCLYLETPGGPLPADDIRKCYTCNACTAACPADLGIRRLISAAREKKTREQGPGEAQMLADPFSDKNMYRRIGLWKEPISFRSENQKSRVVYFPGCAATCMNQVMGKATVRLLEKAGVSYSTLSGVDNCCGSVSYGAGNTAPIMEMGPRNIEKIRSLGADTLITTCPGCYRAFKKIYPQLFGDLGFDVMQTSEYFLHLIESGRLTLGAGRCRPAGGDDTAEQSDDDCGSPPDGLFASSAPPAPLRLYYQDPCHLTRAAGMHEAPRKVLSLIPGAVLVNPSPESSVCCGFGGGVRTIYPEISLRQARTVRGIARGMGADIIVTNCGGCMKNIIESEAGPDGRAADGSLPVFDIAELLCLAAGCGPTDRDDQMLVVLSNRALLACMSFYTYDPYKEADVNRTEEIIAHGDRKGAAGDSGRRGFPENT